MDEYVDDVLKALKAVEGGADPEKVIRALSWSGMEEFVATACSMSGFRCVRDLRLKAGRRRAQIDVVAATPTLCMVIDCKRWKKPLAGKTLASNIHKSVERTKLLADTLDRLFPGEGLVFFTPVILALYSTATQPVSGVFVLPATALIGLLKKPEELLHGAFVSKKLSPKWLGFFESYNLNQGRTVKTQFGQALGALENELHKDS
ncbi:MAG: NERD domain-containing protein [Candidatus Caldarchaeum sp.]|nr:NERD domain-containing protein [Candidatus Caldarchaeum sp.]